MANQFEINIALVGSVSAGKSTVLNALLGQKYSEVSTKKTTAGINFFKVLDEASNGIGNTTSSKEISDFTSPPDNSSSTESSIIHHVDDIRSSSSIHEEIEKDNQRLWESKAIEEKHFNIQLRQPLVQMRKDTSLVIVDIPGIEEAGTSNMYKQYVKDNWSTFDCAIVVLDVRQGVNETEVLNFVKDNNVKNKKIPTVIVGNKVDDPEDDDQLELVAEVQHKVEEIFGTGCSKEALDRIKVECSAREHPANNVDSNNTGTNKHANEDSINQDFAVFIPMSAMHAFRYRSTSGLSFDEFKKLDMKLIEKIGQEEISRFKWKELTEDEQMETAYAAVQDPEDLKVRFEGTRFDGFLYALQYFLGGEKAQAKLIKKQFEVTLGTLSSAESMATCLHQVYNKCVSTNESPDIIKSAFWKFYDDSKVQAFSAMIGELSPVNLHKVTTYLSEYSQVVKDLGWEVEGDKIVQRMKSFAKEYIGVILEEFDCWDVESWYNACYAWNDDTWQDAGQTWEMLSPKDWLTIARSVLLCSSEKYFIERLGQQKERLTEIAEKMSRYCTTENHIWHPVLACPKTYCQYCESHVCGCVLCCKECTSCLANQSTKMLNDIANALKGSYEQDKFIPVNAHDYACIARIKMPESPSEPEHFGHIIWEYCRYLESQ